MIYRLTKHCGGDDNFLRFAVFAIRDANFVEIERQVGHTALYVIVLVLDRSLEKRSRYLQTLLLLWGVVCSDDVIQMSKNEGIHESSGKSVLEFSRAVIHDFCFRDWCALFRVLSNPIEDLLISILLDGGMRSWLPGLVEPMHQGRLHMESWTVKSSRQRIDGDSDIVTRFCNILHVCHLMASKFESSQIRVAS
jgi:hypothetical protein